MINISTVSKPDCFLLSASVRKGLTFIRFIFPHQSFLLAERIDRFQVGVAVQGVGVHAVLKGLHFLNHFLQRRVFDAHVIYWVEQRNAVWETFLHLLQAECLWWKEKANI